LSVSLSAKQSKLFKLALAVKPRPGISWVGLSGTSLVLRGTNGVSGETYVLLTSTNIALPFSQWTPLATNTFSSGSFSITNTANPNAARNFYIIKVQ